MVEILKIKNELLAAILLSGAESEDKVSEEHLSYASYIIYHISNYIGTVYTFFPFSILGVENICPVRVSIIIKKLFSEQIYRKKRFFRVKK